MTFSLFDLTVPRFQRALGVLLGLLGKAEGHFESATAGRGVAVLGDLRLAPDMNPFPFQIASAIDNAVGATRRLRGLAPDDVARLSTLEDMRGALNRALGELAVLTPADFEGAADREIVLPNPKGARHLPAPDYVLNLALPNVLFHTSMAYALLRAAGVDIGKRDFLGPLPPRRVDV
ncbi:DUF1993 family protein [Phenylobacterium sp.]|jgi:hypothetical protein|uniref:DUF1993 family protein n=1 Tax=Phenylobacterium sp. TaxID=1871053 RepID=UPI0037CB4F27